MFITFELPEFIMLLLYYSCLKACVKKDQNPMVLC